MWGCYYLIDFIDHIAGEGKQGRYKLTKEGGTTENVILELDDSAEVAGTPINRENLIGIQGYQNENVNFGNNNITKTNSKGQTETMTFSENQIIKTFVGEKTITQTITFNENGYEKRLS